MTTTWEDLREQAAAQAPVPGWQRGALADKYVVPPFSVLNTASGDWQERKRFWLAMGIQSEMGRGETPLGAVSPDVVPGGPGGFASQMAGAKAKRGAARAFGTDLMHTAEGGQYEYGRKAADGRSNLTQAPLMPDYAAGMGLENMAPGTSIFDPVLCELVYRWWCPDGGVILDPFAGGSVRGVVAGYMGHPYVGVDLSGRQIEANRDQAQSILAAAGRPMPAWHVGDSLQVLPTLDVTADLLFTCPPYFDLEVYSDDPADISAMDWPAFRESYRAIIAAGAARLADDRFAVIVVGEVRDRRHPDGAYVGFVPETIAAFEAAGLRFYNEVILVNAAGSLPVRTGHQFQASRKIGKQHQNVLVFLKGRVSRGWSVERTPPPSPQASMADLIDAPAITVHATPSGDTAVVVDQALPAAVVDPPCPCPMAYHLTECAAHPHRYYNNGAAWGCEAHGHASETRAATTLPAQDAPQALVAADATPAPVAAPGAATAAVVDPDVAAMDARMDPATNWRALDDARQVDITTGEIIGGGDTVTMTASEGEYAQAGADAAAMERYHARGKSRDKHGAEKRRVPLAEARLAELLVARYLGLAAAPIVASDRRLPRQVDVGSDVQVRYASRADGSLITHTADAANDRFVLVTGTPPMMTLHGWAYGHEAKQEEFLRRPPQVPDAAYFMPQARLRPMSTMAAAGPGQPAVSPRRASRAAPPTPPGMTVGAVSTDPAGWVCTGCGTPATEALRTTVQAEIRRGTCATCDRDKPFMVLS
jgi:hypothetical protein